MDGLKPYKVLYVLRLSRELTLVQTDSGIPLYYIKKLFYIYQTTMAFMHTDNKQKAGYKCRLSHQRPRKDMDMKKVKWRQGDGKVQ